MTELEQQLTSALTALSKQYEAEMEQQARAGRGIAGAVAAARRSGQGLKAAAGADRSAGRGFEAAGQTLGSGLQGDRRSVEKGLNVIWQRQQRALERQRGPATVSRLLEREP